MTETNAKSKKKKTNASYGSLIKRMLKDIGNDRRILILLLFVIMVSKLCLAWAPRVSGSLLDYIAEHFENNSIEYKNILIKGLLLAVLYFVGNGADGVVNQVMVRISQRLSLILRNRTQKKLNRLTLNYLDTHPSGDILSRATNDIVTFSNNLESTLPSFIGQFVLLLGIVVMMLVTNWKLTLIYVVTLPLGVRLTAFISKKTKKQFSNQQRLMGVLNSIVSDTIDNHMIMKAYTCEDERTEHFKKCSADYKDAYIKSRFYSGFIIPLGALVTNISYILLCVIGCVMMINGKLTIGGFQAFLFYGNMVSGPLGSLSSSFNNIQISMTAIDRIYTFLDEDEMPDETPATTVDIKDVKGEIRFEHAKFSYVPDKPLMQDVSFTVKPGMTAAIVGPSGAGKTTIVNLLMRFYEIQGGNIYLDDTDIKQLSLDNLRSAFGMVLQDTWIFAGTVAENIGFGKTGASRDEIIKAAEIVQCDSFIKKLPNGYDTHISEENSSLSSGEKQLLSIARTVLADPKILILDEATSQVDTKTELLITEAMNRLMEGRTCFVIAHRLYTIRNSDIIIFMKDGDIKEVGNHDELMRLNGLYASMYNSASD